MKEENIQRQLKDSPAASKLCTCLISHYNFLFNDTQEKSMNFIFTKNF